MLTKKGGEVHCSVNTCYLLCFCWFLCFWILIFMYFLLRTLLSCTLWYCLLKFFLFIQLLCIYLFWCAMYSMITLIVFVFKCEHLYTYTYIYWRKAKTPPYEHTIVVYDTNIVGLPSEIAHGGWQATSRHSTMALSFNKNSKKCFAFSWIFKIIKDLGLKIRDPIWV